MLSAEGISYGTRDREILYEISLRAEAGEFVGIIGPNGSGKSTLLKNLYKVLRPRAGRAFLMGEDLLAMSGREMAQRLAVVVQEHESGFDFTVEEVVRMGRHARKGLLEADNGQDRSLVDRVLRLTQLEEVREQSYTTLSGGEKQRVLIARALVQDTPCLILDEPTNHLDLESREALVLALQKFTGTLLMVAHDRWLLSQVGVEAWELNENGITIHAGFAAYDADRRARLAGAGTDSRGGAALSAAGLPKMSSEAAREVAPGFSREEQKRLKREQAEKRNALHKELKPLQSKYTALEEELARVLDEQSAVEGRLADPEVYADHSRSGELLKRFEECKRRGEDLLEEMAGLEEKITAIKVGAE